MAETGMNIRVLERSLAILAFMAEERRLIGVTEIAEATDLSKSTVHRILSTFREKNVVLRDEGGRYQVGPAVLLWADAYRRSSGLAEIARPFMRRLWEETHETVHLFIYENGKAFYLDKLDSPHPVGMRSRIGAPLSLYSTSGGRAILAALPEAELDAYLSRTTLERRTNATVTDPEALRRVLDDVRRNGWAEENQENEEGIRCIGAAVRSLDGTPAGAVSISAPAYRMSDERARALCERVRSTAEGVSRELGYRG